MHPALTAPTCPTELFTRERRRRRMKEFLQTFEQQTWTSLPEVHRVLSIQVVDCRSGPPGAIAQRAK